MALPDYVQSAIGEQQTSGLPDYVRSAIGEQPAMPSIQPETPSVRAEVPLTRPEPAVPEEIPSEIREFQEAGVPGIPVDRREPLRTIDEQKAIVPPERPEITTEEEIQLKQSESAGVRATLPPALSAIGFYMGGLAGPGTAVAGGAGGFALGDRVADIFDQTLGLDTPDSFKQEMAETLKSLEEGLKYEAAGPVLGKGLGVGVKFVDKLHGQVTKFIGNAFPAMSDKAIMEKAGKVLKDVGVDVNNPEINRNIIKSQKVQEEFPGVKFTGGQLKDDANLIRLERDLVKTGTGRKAREEQLENVAVAVRRKLDSTFDGRNGTSDIIDEVKLQREAFEDELLVGEKSLKLMRDKFNPKDVQAGGKTISGELTGGRDVMKAKVDELYKDVPNEKIPTNNLNAKLIQIRNEFIGQGHRLEDFPKEISDLVKETTPRAGKITTDIVTGRTSQAPNVPKIIEYNKLKSRRSIMGGKQADAKKALTPDRVRADYLGRAFNALDNTMDEVVTINPTAKEAHDTAKAYFRRFSETYREGKVGKVLRPDRAPDSNKISLANITSEFFGPTKSHIDAADDLIRALGEDGARASMRDSVSYELLNNPSIVNSQTGEINGKGLATWIKRHSPILNKYGLLDDIRSLSQAQELVDSNMKNLDVFNKSVAGKLLNGSPDIAIVRAFDGQKDTAQVARELMFIVKNNPSATEGVRKSFSDMLRRQVLDSTEGIVAEPLKTSRVIEKTLKKYEGAIKVLYKNDKDKIKALNDTRRLFRNLSRSNLIDGGVVRDKESIGQIAVQAGGPLITSRLSRLNAYNRIRVFFEGLSKEQVDEVLVMAAFDPSFAKLLTSPHLKMPDKAYNDLLLRSITRLGLQTDRPFETENQ